MILKNGKRIDGCTDTLPVGTVQPFLGLTPPLGYLVCQGQLISKIEYPELYRICGSTFGTETDTHFYLPDLRGKTIAGYDSSDTAMNTIGKLLGNKTHTHTSAAHTHTIAGHVHSTGNHTLTVAEMPSHAHNVIALNKSDSGYLPSNGNGAEFVLSYNDTTFYTPSTRGWNNPILMNATGGSGAHNHGNTGSTALTSDSTTPGATGSNTNFQPTITMNWIVKAVMLIPEYFIVENTLTSTSTSNALSAAQGQILNNKFNNYLPIDGTAKFAEALPNFVFGGTDQPWGNQIGECIYRANDSTGGSLAFRKNNPNAGQMSCIIDGYFYQKEGVYRCLDTDDLGNYAFYKFPVFSLNSAQPSLNHSLSIVSKGRPIFIAITGDLDSDTEGGSWARIVLQRDGITLTTEIVQGTVNSQNVPFAINYLDVVGAGTHTYKVVFEQGGNDSTFGEEGWGQTPDFVIYEI